MKKIVVLLTACLLLLGASLSVAAQVAEPIAALNYNDLDYRESTKKTATAYMGDVLASLEGITVSEQERAYIRYEFNGQSVLYYTKPALLERQYDYDGEHKRMTVTVMQDSYEPQKHDTIVEWIPTTATVGDVSANFVPARDLGPGYYRAVFEDFLWSEELTAMVEYRAQFEVSAETLNEYVNYAYEQALLLHDEVASLEDRRAAYAAALELYETNRDEWANFENDCDQYDLHQAKVAKYQDYLAYQAYLVSLEEYRIAHEAYLANQREWEKYEQDSIKYQQYLNYKNEEYPQLYAQYQAQMSTVQQQLALLALWELEDPNTGVSFIEMMSDDRIATMISEKRGLVTSLVGSGPVDAIIESTNALQNFCKTYQSLPTEQEKYTYYIKEYNKMQVVTGGTVSDGLVKHLRQLYTNIKTLYETKAIYVELQKDYPEHISTLVRMLGSLYVQRCVFDDTVTLNLNEIVDTRGGQKASALVHASVRPAADTNKATPLSVWPTAPANPGTYEVTVKPTAPVTRLEDATYPTKPTFTTVSSENELDDYMEDPGHMDQPTPPAERLSHPGQEPSLDWKETEQGLYEAYLAGDVTQRPEFTESQMVAVCVTNQFAIELDQSERCYYVYFHTDEGAYLGRSLGVTQGEEAKLPAGLRVPEKASDVQYHYEFAGWVNEAGELLDLSCVTEDQDAYASYTPVLRKYRVTWNVEGVTTVQEWQYGDTPTFTGATDKVRDERYEYTFIGWDKQPAPVAGDVTYTAKYEKTDRRYSVTFDMADGTSPIVKEYRYGQSLAEVAAALSKPYLAPTAEYTYTFIGWRNEANGRVYAGNELPSLTENMTFTAVFESTKNAYTVTWIVDGVATTGRWVYGDTPWFGENQPHKEMDERYYYAFAGWDAEIVPVTGDVTYTAEFVSTVRLYRVDFVIEGKAFTFELEYEQMPVFEEIPQKDSDVQYDYTFIGWDNDPVPVRKDAIYVAEFGKIVRKYPVKFVVGGSELIAEFEYGTVPKYSGAEPIKPDDALYRYIFIGWDKEIVAVDGTAVTYTACFDAVPLAPGADGENGKLTVEDDGSYQLALNGTRVDLSLIFDKAGEEQVQALQVLFGNAVVVFPKAQIDAFYLMGNGITEVSLALTEHEGRVAYKLTMLDESGAPVSYLVTELTVKLPYSSEYAADVFSVAEDGTLTKLTAETEDGYLVVPAMESATFVIKERYTVSKNPTENGVFDVVGEAYEGDVIVITPDPDEGYHIDGVVIEYGGQQIVLEPEEGKYSFVMPGEDVQVFTTFKVVEGGTVSEVTVGVCTALLIVAIGFVIAIVLRRRKTAKV